MVGLPISRGREEIEVPRTPTPVHVFLLVDRGPKRKASLPFWGKSRIARWSVFLPAVPTLG